MSTFSKAIVYMLLVQTVCSELTTIPHGQAFVEDPAEERRQCAMLDISLNMPSNHTFLTLLSQDCAPSQEGRRQKKLVPLVVAGVAIAFSAVGFSALIGFYIFSIRPDLIALREENEQLESVVRKILTNQVVTHKEVLEMMDSLNQEHWEQLHKYLFEKSALETILQYFNYEPLTILKDLGFDTTIGFDVIKTMDFTFVCGQSIEHYQLEICGRENPTRKYGDLSLVAPVGNFLPGSHAYRYYNVPKYLITTPDGKKISSDKCEKIGRHFKCEFKIGECSALDYEKCPKIIERTEDKVFSVNIGDSTFIATTLTNYRLYKMGSTTGQLQQIPQTGHFLFQAPHTSSIRFATNSGRVFRGRHDSLVITPISVFEKMEHLTHEELDKWNEMSESAGKGLDKLELKFLHDNYGWHFDWDSLKYFWIWFPTASKFVLGIFILAAGLVIYAFLKRFCGKK